MTTSTVRTLRRWTREEYERMIDAGVFQPGEHAELLDGEIWITMTPQKSPHATAIRAAEETFRGAFGSGHDVRAQLPLALGGFSEPEPDVAVVPGSFQDYWESHPTAALVVLEVADSTLKDDRERKGSLYAQLSVQDYWIANLVDNVLEVYREPVPDPEAKHGWRYCQVQRFRPGEHVSPLARPDLSIPVSSFLRPR